MFTIYNFSITKLVFQPRRMLLKVCDSLPVFTLHTSVSSCLKPTCLNLQNSQKNMEKEDPTTIKIDAENSLNGKVAKKPKIEFYRRKLPASCISFSSAEGKEIFKESLVSGHLDCYFPLAAQFRTQEEPAFCGLSTLVMVLNTLEVDPKKVWKGPWRWYHENMLDCCIPLFVVEKMGINMEQFLCLAACNMLKVKMTRANNSTTEESFRHMVMSVTRRTDQIMVVSYSRSTLGQSGDGHFSPIGGYNAKRDMALIMDTARFKYPPHWVSLADLFTAMQMIDSSSGLARGYFILSKNQFNPGLLFRLSSFFSPLGMHHKLTNFFKSWETLLATDLTGTDLTGSDVAELAVVDVVKLLNTLEPEVYLLTTQLDTKFAEAISYKSYLHTLLQLISNIEGLPFFRILVSRSCNAGKDSLSHAGSIALSELKEDLAEIKNAVQSLEPVHFLAIFMLSWPYQDCGRHSVGSNLNKYFASQLARSDVSCLQNECARIRQQLISLVRYNKKCQQGCCNMPLCQDTT